MQLRMQGGAAYLSRPVFLENGTRFSTARGADGCRQVAGFVPVLAFLACPGAFGSMRTLQDSGAEAQIALCGFYAGVETPPHSEYFLKESWRLMPGDTMGASSRCECR